MKTVFSIFAVSFMVVLAFPSLAAAAEGRQEDTVLDEASDNEEVADNTRQETSEYLDSRCCREEGGAKAKTMECLEWQCGAGITGGTLGGAVSGAGAGAGVGALVTGANPAGAAIGAVLGGVVGAVAGGLAGYAATPACGHK